MQKKAQTWEEEKEKIKRTHGEGKNMNKIENIERKQKNKRKHEIKF